MGLPTVTRRGDRHAARVGASINTSLGMTNLIADSDDDYVAKAAALASDIKALAEEVLEGDPAFFLVEV